MSSALFLEDSEAVARPARKEGPRAPRAGQLDLPHQTFSSVAAQEDQTGLSGVAVVSRWC
jgi:hypothetical protein